MSLALVFRFCTSLAFGDLHLSSMESTGDVVFFLVEAWFQKRFKQKKRRRAWLVKLKRFLNMYLFK